MNMILIRATPPPSTPRPSPQRRYPLPPSLCQRVHTNIPARFLSREFECFLNIRIDQLTWI